MDIAAGIIGGIVATHVTDYAGKLLWKATPSAQKASEPETGGQSSAETAARKLLETTDGDLSENNVQAMKTAIHYGLGMTWGPLYCWLRRNTGMTPVTAGIASGTALSLIFDQTLNPLLGVTPPNSAYPASAHVRGLATHVIWGLVSAATTESLQCLHSHPLPAAPRRPSSPSPRP